MLVSMQNSDLINKLVMIADGDIELVQRAIRASAERADAADLQKVVKYITTHRKRRVLRPSQHVAA